MSASPPKRSALERLRNMEEVVGFRRDVRWDVFFINRDGVRAWWARFPSTGWASLYERSQGGPPPVLHHCMNCGDWVNPFDIVRVQEVACSGRCAALLRNNNEWL